MKKQDIYDFLGIVIVLISIAACTSDHSKTSETPKEEQSKKTFPHLFTLLAPTQTGINFQNTLTENLNANVLVYEYLYNGGGVATGDFNGDGKQDIYFTSNMGENKFYINSGDMKFEDVTAISKVSGRAGPWKTGISAADVNGDGKLDLYLCYSGVLPDPKRKNQLFINMGNDANNIPIFEDKAAEFGIDSPAYSNQGYFFDYDEDGDLDMLLLNHNPKSLPVLNEFSTKEFLKKDDPLQGLRLYQQNNGTFIDVTISAGISGSALSYGLGIAISDVNNDGWIDFYVSNDYTIPDYLYINNGDGTFTDQLQEGVRHTSHFSMGNDIADINNDGNPDILTLDMLPEDNRRQKLLMAPDNYEKFDLNVRSGFHYQYMRNMLQLNNGNGTFSETGQLSGISNTDWSWAALLADFQNDGLKDLFVTNGYYRDYTNLDFINYMENYVKSKGRLKREDVLEIIKKMPSSNLTNYMFINKNGTSFANETKNLGLDQPANSNGAAYADLDNDGDLDLIVNNINKPAFIYRNETQKQGKKFLQIQLNGSEMNTHGIGSKVTIYYNKKKQTLEQMPTKGYLSTVSSILNFGLGNESKIDSLIVQWNNGKRQRLDNLDANELVVLNESNAEKEKVIKPIQKTWFSKVPSPIAYSNISPKTNDFKRQSLLLAQLSYSGPCMAKGDVNNDGFEDIFIGGSKGQSAELFLQTKNKNFQRKSVQAFEQDMDSHDTDVAIFDANGDGNLDLYVTSGGYHDYIENDPRMQDRLYIGDGQGDFLKKPVALPKMYSSTSSVNPNDINDDGYMDLFVGGRVIPGRYPERPQSFILINDGSGNFSDQTEIIAPELRDFGMITDAVWTDINNDTFEDLIVVGEWVPISVFINNSGSLENNTPTYLEKGYSGWWNTIKTKDFNADGKPDFIVGNMGTNTQFEVSETQTAELLYDDFDSNGSVDPLFSYYVNGNRYPYPTRDEILGQLASLRSKYPSYESYADATLEDILSKDKLSNAKRFTANRMETTLFLSTSNDRYTIGSLPIQTQYSPVYDVNVSDFNGDGNSDMILFGNNYHFKLRMGRFDANYGQLLLGDGKGGFNYIKQTESGLNVRGEIRSSILFDDSLILGSVGESLKAYKISKSTDNKAY